MLFSLESFDSSNDSVMKSLKSTVPSSKFLVSSVLVGAAVVVVVV